MILFVSITGFGQTQSFVSYKNIITSRGDKSIKPIETFEIKRILFVPTTGKTYKTLIIAPNKGIEDLCSIQLLSVNNTVRKGKTKKIYYNALENNRDKRTVIVTTNDGVLTLITVIIKVDSSTLEWTFTNIKPIFQEN